MNKLSRNFLNALVVIALLGMSVLDANAGDDKRRGTAGASQLLVPVTARNASLGASNRWYGRHERFVSDLR